MKTMKTMKTMKKTVLAICCLVMVAGTAWAVDYSKMSTEDLSRMRGTLYNANQTEWSAFHAEWQKRLGKMTVEQRQQYMGPGQGRGMAMGRGMGRGMGWRAMPASGATGQGADSNAN
jgi:hypothetical protein